MQNNHLEAIRRLQQKAEEVSRLQKEASERMDQSSHHSLASMEMLLISGVVVLASLFPKTFPVPSTNISGSMADL